MLANTKLAVALRQQPAWVYGVLEAIIPTLFRQQFAAEFWLAFFLERCEPFGIVCSRAELSLGNVFLFDGLPQTNALVTDLCHELARGHEGSGRALGRLGDFFTREFQQLIFRHGT